MAENFFLPRWPPASATIFTVKPAKRNLRIRGVVIEVAGSFGKVGPAQDISYRVKVKA